MCTGLAWHAPAPAHNSHTCLTLTPLRTRHPALHRHPKPRPPGSISTPARVGPSRRRARHMVATPDFRAVLGATAAAGRTPDRRGGGADAGGLASPAGGLYRTPGTPGGSVKPVGTPLGPSSSRRTVIQRPWLAALGSGRKASNTAERPDQARTPRRGEAEARADHAGGEARPAADDGDGSDAGQQAAAGPGPSSLQQAGERLKLAFVLPPSLPRPAVSRYGASVVGAVAQPRLLLAEDQ